MAVPFLAAGGVAGQEPLPMGGAFQVNSHTPTTYEEDTSVGMDGEGHLVVVWESYGSPGSDVSYNSSIPARRYAAPATPLGGRYLGGHRRTAGVW